MNKKKQKHISQCEHYDTTTANNLVFKIQAVFGVRTLSVPEDRSVLNSNMKSFLFFQSNFVLKL